jgi:hypothetical protein
MIAVISPGDHLTNEARTILDSMDITVYIKGLATIHEYAPTCAE